MKTWVRNYLVGLATLALFVGVAPAQKSAAPDVDPTTQLFSGRLFIAGGGGLPKSIYDAFASAAGGREGTLVVIPTASARADSEEGRRRALAPWIEEGWSKVVLLHTRDREEADSEAFSKVLETADAVWISGGSQTRLADAYRETLVHRRLSGILGRGGVVGGSSAGAAIVSDPMIGGGRDEPRMVPGLGLLPGVWVDQHFAQRERLPRLRFAVSDSGRPGLGIDEKTCLVVRGRSLRVIGDGQVQVVLPGDPVGDDSATTLDSGDRLDLVQLRRAARDRVNGSRSAPKIWTGPTRGTLLVGGGGRLPAAAYTRFLRAAGGAEASIVVVPTAIGEGAEQAGQRTARSLQRLGAKSVMVLHETDRTKLADPAWRRDNLDVLRGAKGIWFTGGRQWRLVDAYAGTIVEELFRSVLDRGGVIAGSSAGASIQAELLVRGHPLGNRVMEAEGYLEGFGYLGGVAVDQHFTERGRLPDLVRVVRHNPGWLGIGLDEGTLIEVRADRVEVFGRGDATFLVTKAGEKPQSRKLADGESVSLSALRAEWLAEVESGEVDRGGSGAKNGKHSRRELERAR